MMGIQGGEGGQVPQAIAIDPTGKFLIFGTDVGGIYRSLDGGAHWQPSDRGFKPRGASALAIDPKDSRRILAVGCNSNAFPWNGLWLSTDQGASWKPVKMKAQKGSSTYHESVAFDPSYSFKGHSQRAYWLADSDGGGGLWRSTDGGISWTLIQPGYADGIVKVDPVNGVVYLATIKGFFRSGDGGASFSQIIADPVSGLDVISTQPHLVYINEDDGVHVSEDDGLTFTSRKNIGFKTIFDLCLKCGKSRLRNLKVSPADPKQMLINDDQGELYQQKHYYSKDGGDHWTLCGLDSSNSFIPANPRPWMMAWHPTDPQKVWAFGGDFITQSTDGGESFTWANNGYNGVAALGFFNFNVQNPEQLLITSQDYNSAWTHNGGATWTYLNPSGNGWGGFTYGGYALNDSTFLMGVAANWSGPRTLYLSQDGGHSWKNTGDQGSGTDTACGDPSNPKIAFWNDWRTLNGGGTWSKMANCQGVYASNFQELYGANGIHLVHSQDHGATWTSLVDLPGPVSDIACDPKGRRLFISAEGSLFIWTPSGGLVDISSRLPADNAGQQKACSVAIDAQNPDVVYVAWHGDTYMTDQAVRRSLDGGWTWHSLTLRPGQPGLDGGREAGCVRVNPKTRFLYVAGQCYGLWKYPPPP